MAAGDAFLLTGQQFAAATLFILLAGVLLAVRFNSRVNRAFAMFLLLRGSALLLQAFARLDSNADIEATLFNVARYFVLATPFVLLYFVVLYRSPQGGLAVRTVGIIAILCTLVIELAYLADHCTFSCAPGEFGPLTPIVQALPLAEGVAGLILAITARVLMPGPRARSTMIVAAAFALLALLEGAQILSLVLSNGWATFEDVDPWLAVARVGPLVGFASALVAVAIILPISRLRGRVLLMAASVIVVTTTLVQLYLEEQAGDNTTQALSLTTALFGTWRLLAAALVAYALVRHRFLDLDLRINWTISRGTVLSILVATFLVVSKIFENALNSKLGVIFGGVATGLLMLAIKPLERLGDRVANGVLPRGRSAALAQDARIALFREQAVMVWSDGTMGLKERLLLDNLRERLGISPALAMSIEHEAASQTHAKQNASALSSRV